MGCEKSTSIGPFEDGIIAYDKGDYATAIQLWRPLADDGMAAAQCNLGTLYQFGWAVTQDYAEAVRWYRRAARQGFVPAQHNLGSMYHNGEGVTQDFTRAYMWWSLAASHGLTAATVVRDALADLMTPQQLAKARSMAATWKSKAPRGTHTIDVRP
jgi:TPR repeat protein